MTRLDEHLKLMQMGRQLLAVDMADLEATGGFDPIITTDAQQESDDYEAYYLQFPAEYRREAIEMAKYYQVFYCLENTIRDLVESQLEEAHGENWWETKAPEAIRLAVEKNKKREQDNGVTLRSSHPIDYTTFGELSEIIKEHWDIFGATFNSKTGLERVMAGLNLLRGPVAHCAPLAEDEVHRLRLAVRSYYRLME